MMKKNVFLFAVFFAMALFLSACAPLDIPSTDLPGKEEVPSQKILVTDQLRKQIAIYDIADSDWSSPEWVWTTDAPTFYYPDGVKYRYSKIWQTYVVLVTSSGGYCAAISYPSGEVLARISDAGGNPHSIELLPDGSIAVASSGGYVRIYSTASGSVDLESYIQFSLAGAHGVLWDPKYEVLWALGTHVLEAYRLTGTPEAPAVSKQEEMCSQLPDGGGHDLAPVYGDTDALWVTGESRVMQYCKDTKKWNFSYDGAAFISSNNVKGIGNFPETKTVVRTVPDGTYQSWNTKAVDILTWSEKESRYLKESREIPGGAIYKVRVCLPDYQ